jgi:asparagine synthase (glutamine-hydrolysing)
MCGITGVFAYRRGELPLDEPTLGRMTDALSHRGPDDRGVHLDPVSRVGLGHRRLSIIDLAAGRQPMANDDGSIWIVYNGEVYNHVAIRKELEQHGVRFRTHCDTEVILRLYEAEGEGCMRRLDGMFAFAIYDGRRRALFLARDRIGVKPLYWCDQGGAFYFASEPRALFEHPELSRRLDEESLYHHLSFLCTPAPHTMFEGIRKLPPGHTLTVTADGLREARWWDVLDAPEIQSEEARDPDRAARVLLDKLREAVEARMMSDVPFGVFLSGGIDSSTNAVLMAECSSLPINTFTVAYEGPGVAALNEMEHARRIARQIGANHREVVIDQRSVLEYLPEFVRHQDEPVADPVCVPLYYVSKLAVDHGVKVVQVGEGSDELFLGYEPYLESIRFDRLARSLRRLPAAVGRAGWRGLSPALRAVGHRALRWEELLRRCAYEDPFWGGAIVMGDREKRELVRRRPDASSWQVVESLYREIDGRWPGADVAARMAYVELRQRLPELLLARVDKISMSVGLEARVPFLDHHVVEYAMRIPAALKLEGGKTKALLKRAVAGLLPEDLIHRRKQGFPAPISQWLHTEEFGGAVAGALRTSPLVRDGYLDGAWIERRLHDHLGRRADHGGLLWVLFNLTLWYRRWILAEGSG